MGFPRTAATPWLSGQGSERLEMMPAGFGARRSVGFRLIRFPVAVGISPALLPGKTR